MDDGAGSSVLFVTAHPDDEAMFFGPAILALGCHLIIHVLCLSTGDADGLGSVRKEELVQACAVLGIPAPRVTVVDDARLRDGKHTVWKAEAVAEVVWKHLRRRRIQRVVTFDECGVSGHPNHSAVCIGVRHLLSAAAVQSKGRGALCVYTLHSTSLIRRFMGWLDAVWTVLIAVAQHQYNKPRAREFLRVCCVSLEPWRSHKAMSMHASQYVWFRRLYILFSRYIFVNTLQPVAAAHGGVRSS